MLDSKEQNLDFNQIESDSNVSKVGRIRRFAPQAFVSLISNCTTLSKSLFNVSVPLIIAALLGISNTLNPNETIRITPVEASWLATLLHISHPFGSILSGFVSDSLGRRKGILIAIVPTIIGFISLAFVQSFQMVYVVFLLLGFFFGLKDAPSAVYISEVSEPSVRGTLLSIQSIVFSMGAFLINLLGSFLSWRQVILISTVVPSLTLIATLLFMPESPKWLLSKGREIEAQKSLQWLRGWVSSQSVHDEYTKLQSQSKLSYSCVSCAKQSIDCNHPKPTIWDKIKELKRKRTLKPLILVLSLNFFMEFCITIVSRPYIIQVIKAFGMPLDANKTLSIISVTGILSNFCYIFGVHFVGKRRFYLWSTAVVVLCSFALSVYGYVFFPSNWTSFKNPADPSIPNFDLIRDSVGNYGYLALILLLIIQFGTGLGINAAAYAFLAEVFSFKLRSFVCGVTMAFLSPIAILSKKTYYDIEIWLTLPGAVLFYTIVTFIGWITMYFIMPETEKRSLEDIERHYADDSKGITDINIRIKTLRNIF